MSPTSSGNVHPNMGRRRSERKVERAGADWAVVACDDTRGGGALSASDLRLGWMKVGQEDGDGNCSRK